MLILLRNRGGKNMLVLLPKHMQMFSFIDTVL